MRISTTQVFTNGIAAIQREQAELARVQEQLASGKRMLSPSDDPGGAVQALKFRERIDAVEQYARNASLATSRLEHEETVLDQLASGLERVRELTVQAANGSQSDDSRAAIARELREISAGLLGAANARDANGEYLFAGYRSASRPFVVNGAGEVEYLGDAGERRVALSPDRSVAIGDGGAAFMDVPRGNGSFIVTPGGANAGTGLVAAAEVVDPTAVTDDSFTLRFTAPDSYELLDAGGAVLATGAFEAGQAIDIGGRRIVITGTPAAGDGFAIEPAGSASLFATVDRLAAELETPRADAAARAQLAHATGVALEDLDQALGRVLELRTSVGARLNTIESQMQVGEEQELQLRTALSEVEDLDYAEAVSRFSLKQVALQAAQQTYVQLGRLSLFDFLR